jgi:putative hemolysin
MQSGPVATAHFGYYSQQEFEFAPYEHIRPRILELGRACIHKDHRNSEVLTLLWRTIATYCRFHGLRYLIGCSSLTSRDPSQGWALYHQIQDFLAPTELRTTVLPGYQLPLRADHSSTHVKIP